MEKRYYHADGHIIWVMLSVSLVRDAAGVPLYFISQIADITERKWREEELQDRAEQLAIIASTDRLTGLSTRRAWDMAITERIRRRGDRAGTFAVALIDLDGLKEINDTRGHDAGDDALAATASALRAALRDGAIWLPGSAATSSRFSSRKPRSRQRSPSPNGFSPRCPSR